MPTRAQAIADGMLVDVSQTPEAIEAGFKYPVALRTSPGRGTGSGHSIFFQAVARFFDNKRV